MTIAYLTKNNAYTSVYIPSTGVVYTLGSEDADPALANFLGDCGDFTDWAFPYGTLENPPSSEEEIEDQIGNILAVRDDESPSAEIRDCASVRERWEFFGLPIDECPNA